MKTFLFCIFLSVLLLIVGCVHTTNENGDTQFNINATYVLEEKNVRTSIENAIPSANDSEKQQTMTSDADMIVAKLGKRKMRCGTSSSTGVWVAVRIDLKVDEHDALDQQLATAEVMAKRDIASWMSTVISSEAELSRTKVVEYGETTQLKEVYSSLVRTDFNALLRGVTMVSYSQDDKGLHAIFYTTGKIVDATAELQVQLNSAPKDTVRATGYSIVTTKGVQVAKKQATAAALRSAVEQVMETTIIAQSALMDNVRAKSRLINQTSGNVKEYRIVSEGEENQTYYVILNAKVSQKSLLDNYSTIVRSMGNPGFFLACNAPDLQTSMRDFFCKLGFNVVENEKDAQFVATSTCRFIGINDKYYDNGQQVIVQLKLVDSKKNQELFCIQNEPRFTSTYNGTESQIHWEATAKAFRSIKDKLHENLNKIVMDWILNGREVNVILENSKNPDFVKILEDAFQWVPCATYHTKTQEGDRVIFHCAYIGPTADFCEDLLARLQLNDEENAMQLPFVKHSDLNSITLSF